MGFNMTQEAVRMTKQMAYPNMSNHSPLMYKPRLGKVRARVCERERKRVCVCVWVGVSVSMAYGSAGYVRSSFLRSCVV